MCCGGVVLSNRVTIADLIAHNVHPCGIPIPIHDWEPQKLACAAKRALYRQKVAMVQLQPTAAATFHQTQGRTTITSAGLVGSVKAESASLVSSRQSRDLVTCIGSHPDRVIRHHCSSFWQGLA